MFEIFRYTKHIDSLDSMKKYPKELYYVGDLTLLDRPKVSIVGSRRPMGYTKEWTQKLSKELSSRGVVVVSGGAMGVDAIAHIGAGAENSICVCASGLDILYPRINRTLLESIYKKGLAISQFPKGFTPTPWSFVVRNELVVALGDILIITEANLNSGSMRSAEFALKMGKRIYVLPHRLNESLGTNSLLAQSLAEPILDIEKFCSKFGVVPRDDTLIRDDFFYFCQNSPTLDEAVAKFGSRVYEAELDGVIKIDNGVINLV